jgi:N-acyl-D-aspartate/D-glutamate deacylase
VKGWSPIAEYDLLIKNGTIDDGMRMPAFRGDVGIRAGKIVAIGNLKETPTRTIDATGMVVAPGFIDLHTHYDAALSGGTKWDPYASLSGWHGVTTVAIGNCGFGFAPVKPEDRERAMLRMERTESIPLSCMKAGMRWDWVTLTFGRYPTHFLAHWVRDKHVMSLEEAHWRLSTMVGWAIGVLDRGWLREGMAADIVDDLEKLKVKPMETVRDLPDGDWRRVQKAEGYRYMIVNGQITFEDNVCSGALPGKLLRSYDQVPG